MNPCNRCNELAAENARLTGYLEVAQRELAEIQQVGPSWMREKLEETTTNLKRAHDALRILAHDEEAKRVCPRCGDDPDLVDQDPDVPDLWEVVTSPAAWGAGPHLGMVAVHLLLMLAADRRGVVHNWRSVVLPVLGAVANDTRTNTAEPKSVWLIAEIEALVIGARGLIGRGLAEQLDQGDLRLLVGGAS